MSEGMLVAREWLEKADAALNKQDAAPAPEYGKASTFYDIRPARLQTAWTQNNAGVWKATARFIVNDLVDDSFTFDVYAPTATASPGGTAESTRFFVVWRGRWEMVAGAGENATKGDVVKTVSVSKSSFVKSIATTTENFLTSASISKSTTTKNLVTSVAVNGGSLVFTYDTAVELVSDVSASTQSGSAIATATPTTGDAVVAVSSTNQSVVYDLN